MSRRALLRVTVVGLGLVGCSHTPPMSESIMHHAPPAGFTSLLNGRDLTGWRGLVGGPPKLAGLSFDDLATAQRAADDEKGKDARDGPPSKRSGSIDRLGRDDGKSNEDRGNDDEGSQHIGAAEYAGRDVHEGISQRHIQQDRRVHGRLPAQSSPVGGS